MLFYFVRDAEIWGTFPSINVGNVPKHQCGDLLSAPGMGDSVAGRQAGVRDAWYTIAGASSGDAQRVLRAGANSGGEMRVCDIRGRQSGGVRC